MSIAVANTTAMSSALQVSEPRGNTAPTAAAMREGGKTGPLMSTMIFWGI